MYVLIFISVYTVHDFDSQSQTNIHTVWKLMNLVKVLNMWKENISIF